MAQSYPQAFTRVANEFGGEPALANLGIPTCHSLDGDEFWWYPEAGGPQGIQQRWLNTQETRPP